MQIYFVKHIYTYIKHLQLGLFMRFFATILTVAVNFLG